MKKVVITGGNRGIGLELIKRFLDENYHVTVLCRNVSDELSNLNVVCKEKVNICSLSSLNKIVEEYPYPFIDVLVNNAGIFRDEVLGDMKESSFQTI